MAISELRISTRGLDPKVARALEELIAKINELVRSINEEGA